MYVRVCYLYESAARVFCSSVGIYREYIHRYGQSGWRYIWAGSMGKVYCKRSQLCISLVDRHCVYIYCTYHVSIIHIEQKQSRVSLVEQRVLVVFYYNQSFLDIPKSPDTCFTECLALMYIVYSAIVSYMYLSVHVLLNYLNHVLQLQSKYIIKPLLLGTQFSTKVKLNLQGHLYTVSKTYIGRYCRQEGEEVCMQVEQSVCVCVGRVCVGRVCIGRVCIYLST